MPPAGVRKGSKDARKYEHIKESVEDRGTSERTAAEIAARTVNKDRARAGRTQTASSSSLRDPKRSSQRGGQRKDAGGRTKDQLYDEAKRKGIDGRSKMTKAQLEKAVDAK